MADTKVTNLTAIDNIAAGDNLYVVDDPGGTPLSRKATFTQLKQFLEITSPPGGRLTVASGTPVVTTSDTGNTTMFYCSIAGDTGAFYVPIYDGTRHVSTKINQLSQLLSDTGDSPAAAAAASVYDMYVWEKGSVPVLSRGRAWESATARDTGNAIESVDGFYVNKTTFTNGPAARRGLWVGTIRTDPSSAEVTWRYGAIAAGGLAGVFAVWNAYNRVDVQSFVGDSVDSFSVDTTIGQDGANMQFSFISGLAVDSFDAAYHILANASGSAYSTNGIGYDSTTAYVSGCNTGYTAASTFNSMIARYGRTAIGWHSVHALNLSTVGTATFYSDAGEPTKLQSGMWFRFKM